MGSTAQFGVICFLLFFGLSQFFQWAKHLTLPLPIFILGGAFLAIASNFDRRAGLPFDLFNPPVDPPKETQPTASTPDPAIAPTASPVVTQAPREVSFTIRKPEK
jgi:hypothetical protein